MNISEIKGRLENGEELIVEVMRNPAELTEWLIWIRESSGKSFMLSDDDGFIKSAEATPLFNMLKSLGFRQATVIF